MPREQWYYDERQRVSAAWFFDPIGVSFPVLISGGALRDPRLPSFTASRWSDAMAPSGANVPAWLRRSPRS